MREGRQKIAQVQGAEKTRDAKENSAERYIETLLDRTRSRCSWKKLWRAKLEQGGENGE